MAKGELFGKVFGETTKSLGNLLGGSETTDIVETGEIVVAPDVSNSNNTVLYIVVVLVIGVFIYLMFLRWTKP